MRIRTAFNSSVLALALALLAGMATIAWAPQTDVVADAHAEDSDAETCVFNITARNKGNSDIWVMFYDSKLRRTMGNTSLFLTWKQMKVQNHRVRPGALMSRTYSADGKCIAFREWRIRMKKGSNFTTVQYETSKGTSERNGYKHLYLGDVATKF